MVAPQPLERRLHLRSSPPVSQTTQPRCSSTSARLMLGSTSNWRTKVARTARRTSDSGNVSSTWTRTSLTFVSLSAVDTAVQAARPEAFQVQEDEGESRGPDRLDDVGPAGHNEAQFGPFHLNARSLAVMTDPELTEGRARAAPPRHVRPRRGDRE